MANSKVSYNFDADTAFTGPQNTTAITANGNVGTRVALDKMTAARGELINELGAEGYKVVVVVSAAKVSAADETYTFTVTGTDAAGSNPVTVASVEIPAGRAAPNQYVLTVDAATLTAIANNVSDVELNLAVTVGGTAPSITVAAAWMALDRNV